MRILVVEDDKLVQQGLRITFDDHSVILADTADEAIRLIDEESFNLMFLDIRLLGSKTGVDVLRHAREFDPLLPVIMMSGLEDRKTIMECLELGAVDYLVKGSVNPSAYPFAIHKASVWRKRQAQALSHAVEVDQDLEDSFVNLVGSSSAIGELKQTISLVGKTDGPFLIIGETGTGKELAAHAIWSAKGGKNRPFITVNCAEFQAGMVEGELFGYEKGAFTGANSQRVGLFEAANDGDIFLDEIGELPLEFQAKLLRVIQEKKIRRVGSNNERQLDFRVIAATNRDLRSEVQKGTFRSDLFYRLDVHSIYLTPLRMRADDIPRLLTHFFEREGRRNPQYSDAILKEILDYSWPGNVRQLIAFVKYISPSVDSVNPRLTEDDWRSWLLKQSDWEVIAGQQTKDMIFRKLSSGGFSYDAVADANRRSYIDAALELAKNNQAAAARLLGISKQRLQSWLAEA